MGLEGKEPMKTVDFCILNDNTICLAAIRTLKENGVTVSHPEKVALILDQIIPPNSAEASMLQHELMDFAREQGISISYGECMTLEWVEENLQPEGLVIAGTCPEIALLRGMRCTPYQVQEGELVEILQNGSWSCDQEALEDGPLLQRSDLTHEKNCPVRVVYLGGSIGGRAEAIHEAAQLLKEACCCTTSLTTAHSDLLLADRLTAYREQKLADRVRLLVSPASSRDYIQAADKGDLEIIARAGGMILNQCASPAIQGRLGAGEVMVTNDVHDEAGYAGPADSIIYKVTTREAIACALSGQLKPVTKEEEKQADTSEAMTFTGRVIRLGDDIDTDIIIPTQYLNLATLEEMQSHCFEPLRPELASAFQKGDIIVAGSNFGCGSSREQAAEVIVASGVKCVVAKSFARIFFRNAINNGLLLIEQPDLPDAVKEGDTITVELNRRILFNGKEYPVGIIAENLYQLILAGGLVKSVQKENGILEA